MCPFHVLFESDIVFEFSLGGVIFVFDQKFSWNGWYVRDLEDLLTGRMSYAKYRQM